MRGASAREGAESGQEAGGSPYTAVEGSGERNCLVGCLWGEMFKQSQLEIAPR